MRTHLLAVLAAVLAGPARAETAADGEPKPVAFDRRWLDPYFLSGPARTAAERFRLEDWPGAAGALEKALAVMPRDAPERKPARFLLAMARMNAGQWEGAGQIFEELHASYPLLAPYHAYYAARCRVRRGDTAGALAWAVKVPEKTVPEAEAALVRLDALAAEKRWAELEAEAARFLDRFPAGPRRPEATFRRAEALEALGRAAEATPLYRKLWSEAAGEWAARATERLEALARAAATPEEAAALRTRTAGEWLARAMVLFERNANTDSEAAFTAALTAPDLDPAIACKAHYHRAQSVWKQRQRARAAPLFGAAEAACRAAGDTDLTVKALYQGARSHNMSGDRQAALALYAKIEAEHPQHSYADDARVRAAEIATDLQDEKQAEALLGEVPTRYPQGDLLGEALWRLAFKRWRAGDWKGTLRWLDENLQRIPREEIWYAEGRAHYWKARVFERLGQVEEAKQSYARAVREYPLSVYALLSLERMRRSFPEQRALLVRELREAAAREDRARERWEFAPRPVFGEPGFRRAVELARLGLGSDARRELQKLGLSAPDSKEAARARGKAGDEQQDVYWIAAILLDRGRLWSASHAIPRYTVTDFRLRYPRGRGEHEWRIAYPRAFPELVGRHSKENDVPEALQFAIMREESAFNPRIESWANALGLTQMLVGTAQRFATWRVTRDALLDPARNVEVGSRFLGFLLQHFGRSVPLAIAGYNAGEGAVDRWLKERGNLELDEFLETIPFDETRNYTKRVLASYLTYSWLYFPDRPVPEISFQLQQARTRAGRPAPARRR